jgi:hypothetical protein
MRVQHDRIGRRWYLLLRLDLLNYTVHHCRSSIVECRLSIFLVSILDFFSCRFSCRISQ